MSSKTSEFEPSIRRLERQAAESSHKDTDLLTVVHGFDLSKAEICNFGETEWSARYGYDLMIRAFYCKELAGFTTEELYEYLADAERAGTLGFDPDHFALDKTAPGRTTFGRAWHERFLEWLKSFIQTSAERILGVAHEVGNPLGMRALEHEDKSDLSSRSEQRYSEAVSSESLLDGFASIERLIRSVVVVVVPKPSQPAPSPWGSYGCRMGSVSNEQGPSYRDRTASERGRPCPIALRGGR